MRVGEGGGEDGSAGGFEGVRGRKEMGRMGAGLFWVWAANFVIIWLGDDGRYGRMLGVRPTKMR